MTNLQLSALLDKYINGKCNAGETAMIEKWYSGYESDPAYLDSLSPEQQELLKNKMFESLLSQINPLPAAEERQVKVIPLYRKWWFGVAAAVLVILLVKVLINYQSPQNRTTGNEESVFQYANSTNHILKQSLADGSIVWLKPHATLTVPKVFDAKFRKVTMNGECFFEITKNPNRPFIISSAHLITKVWGTSFKVVDDITAKEAVVKVITGKVSVSRKGGEAEKSNTRLTGSEVILTPDQKVLFTEKNNQLKIDQKADMQDMELWKHLDLSFENDKLSTIVKVLNSRFKVNIQVNDQKLANEMMTADLSGLNLPEVLEVLKASMNMNYEISGDEISLSKTNK